MTSNWALPTVIEQYCEIGAESVHVPWDNTGNFDNLKNKNGKYVKTIRDLLHIARDPKHNVLEKTYFLKLTGFNLYNVPEEITGIEVKLTMNRFSRITDDTIQLWLDNEPIGENQATLDLSPIKLYGNETDMWRTNLTRLDILNPNFGIILRFGSHPRWPHRSSAMIDTAEIKIH